MARRTFFSFHYKADAWRASQVRNMGVIDGNPPASDNDWESITKGGETAIKTWIHSQMAGRTCTVVLIGANTAGRKWINYEIVKSWNDRMGVLGIYIHHLKNSSHLQSTKGADPFAMISVGATSLSRIVMGYDPPFADSTLAYSHIKINLPLWIDRAIAIRAKY